MTCTLTTGLKNGQIEVAVVERCWCCCQFHQPLETGYLAAGIDYSKACNVAFASETSARGHDNATIT